MTLPETTPTVPEAKDSINLLLVDDKPENLLALEGLLKGPGINIIKASSGNEALGKILENEFACVLLDVQMPEMDGYEVARLVQDDPSIRHTPIIFVTAHSRTDGDVFRGYESGAVDYLFKPLNPTIVKSKVKVFVELFRKQRTIAAQSKELERLNEQLQTSNTELEKFAYLASHDLREPLRMISAYCSLLDRKFGDAVGAEGKSFIAFAVDGATRMQRLVEDLLAYSKLRSEPLVKTEVSLGKLLKEVLTDIQNISVENRAKIVASDLPTVAGNPVQLRQVLQNLLTNAIRYHRADLDPEVEVKAERVGNEWVISIRDNGMGIEEKHFQRIFGMFQRLGNKYATPGTGFGLAICKKIVERHDGRIWLESTPDVGSTFHFSLPV